MKLQTRVNRRVKDKEYLKWYVGIPPDKIKEAGWDQGTELDIVVKDGKIILKTKK